MTFDKTLYRLNDGRSCEVSLKYERQELKRLQVDNIRLFTERDGVRAELSRLQDQAKADMLLYNQDRQTWNNLLLEEKNKRLKTTLRLGGLTIGLAFTTWLLGKTGIL